MHRNNNNIVIPSNQYSSFSLAHSPSPSFFLWLRLLHHHHRACCRRIISDLRRVGGVYESGDGELEPNQKRALHVLEFVRDLAASNAATLCDSGGAAKGLRYSQFTLNVLAAFNAAGGAAVGRVQHLNLGGPVPSTLKRHTRLLTAPFDPFDPERNFEAYAVFVKKLLAQHAGDDVSLRHVYYELVRCS